MAVSSQRPPAGRPPYGRLTPIPRRRRPLGYVVVALLLAVIGVAVAAAVIVRSSHGSLSADHSALANVKLPLGGAKISGVAVVTGPHANAVPVSLRGNQIWPDQPIPAGSQVSIQVTLRRSGSIAWLTGSTQHLSLTLTAPAAHLAARYVTLKGHDPLRVRFDAPVAVASYGAPRHLTKLPLAGAQTMVTVPHHGVAGSVWVAAAPRGWESAAPTLVNWFPAGVRASAVASPGPGHAAVAGDADLAHLLPTSQSGARAHAASCLAGDFGRMAHSQRSHDRLRAPGHGLWPGCPRHGRAPRRGDAGQWSSLGGRDSWQLAGPAGFDDASPAAPGRPRLPSRALPSAGAPVAMTPGAQEAAAVKPPAGSWSWTYGNVPDHLRAMWAPGHDGELTRGAVMAFENDHALGTDGVAGPMVWKALIAATLDGRSSSSATRSWTSRVAASS